MASYAALVSLETTLEKFIRQDQLQILDDEDKRQSFNLMMQNVALLLDFLVISKFAHGAVSVEDRGMIKDHGWRKCGDSESRGWRSC
ncbi:hypothetical protein M569_16001 [Genlisea aurea]|uniref:Uncharacterized protein n=1 Tax=Genlisea aurea TaxID=192259 RepID=S8D7U7_9LAMI|nr:hypothetical protein M569_16001 [Genlisea aurea]